MKKRSFVMKYISDYSCYNYGKTGRANKANRRLGEKVIRNKLKKEMLKEN